MMPSPKESAGNDNQASGRQQQSIRIYVFKSESNAELRAFAGDLDGSKLPSSHGPWTATGSVAPHMDLPHRMSRPAVELAIANVGFQLWRLKPGKEA